MSGLVTWTKHITPSEIIVTTAITTITTRTIPRTKGDNVIYMFAVGGTPEDRLRFLQTDTNLLCKTTNGEVQVIIHNVDDISLLEGGFESNVYCLTLSEESVLPFIAKYPNSKIFNVCLAADRITCGTMIVINPILHALRIEMGNSLLEYECEKM